MMTCLGSSGDLGLGDAGSACSPAMSLNRRAGRGSSRVGCVRVGRAEDRIVPRRAVYTPWGHRLVRHTVPVDGGSLRTDASSAGSGRQRGRHDGGVGGACGLALGALGVVFGDIGTSPLYAMQTVFSIDNGAVKPTEGDVFGVVSLIFWALTLVVSVKYVLFILRADNDGEGGV